MYPVPDASSQLTCRGTLFGPRKETAVRYAQCRLPVCSEGADKPVQTMPVPTGIDKRGAD